LKKVSLQRLYDYHFDLIINEKIPNFDKNATFLHFSRDTDKFKQFDVVILQRISSLYQVE
jgi:hypothetical protein